MTREIASRRTRWRGLFFLVPVNSQPITTSVKLKKRTRETVSSLFSAALSQSGRGMWPRTYRLHSPSREDEVSSQEMDKLWTHRGQYARLSKRAVVVGSDDSYDAGNGGNVSLSNTIILIALIIFISRTARVEVDPMRKSFDAT